MENPPAIVRGFSQRTKPPYSYGIVQPDTFDYQRVPMLDERSRCITPCGGHWQIQVKGLPIVSHHPETTLNDLKEIEKRSTTILLGLYCPVFLGLVITWAVQMAEKKNTKKTAWRSRDFDQELVHVEDVYVYNMCGISFMYYTMYVCIYIYIYMCIIYIYIYIIIYIYVCVFRNHDSNKLQLLQINRVDRDRWSDCPFDLLAIPRGCTRLTREKYIYNPFPLIFPWEPP